jgi:hypothetical protein
MQEEYAMLVDAIRALAPEADWIKDYAFPMFSAFFSAILGAVVAYGTLRLQHRHDAERQKLEILNRWTLNAEQRLQSLIAIKANYHRQLTADPFQRLLRIPSVLGVFSRPEDSAAELSFILPERSDTDGLNEKWRQVPRISALFSNYETLMSLWAKRNEIERPWREGLVNAAGGQATLAVSFEDAVRATSHAQIITLIGITEQVVKMTDDVMLELNDFIYRFPSIGEAVLNMKVARRFGKIANVSAALTVERAGLLERSPAVDIKQLSLMSGIAEESLAEMYGQTAETQRSRTEGGGSAKGL